MGGKEKKRKEKKRKEKKRKEKKRKEKKKLKRLDSPGSGGGKGEGQALVNVAPNQWVPLYAGNLTSYRNVTFSHALLHITSPLCPAELIN